MAYCGYADILMVIIFITIIFLIVLLCFLFIIFIRGCRVLIISVKIFNLSFLGDFELLFNV